MSRIFISYKRVDKDAVFKIKDQIESAIGEKSWIDLDGIESDAQFVSVILDAIDNAQLVLFMYSREHTKITDYEKDWTIRELSYSSDENKRIVFVNLDGTPLSRWFKFMYGQKQQVNGRSQSDLTKLIGDIGKWLGIRASESSLASKETTVHNVVQKSNKESTVRLHLKSAGPSKLRVVKYLKEISGLGLKESKEIADRAPAILPGLYDETVALKIKQALEYVGAKIEIVSKLEPAVNKKNTVRLYLKAVGPSKLRVVKHLKEIFGLGLKESKEIADRAPAFLPGVHDELTARNIQSSLKNIGATVDIV